jgi:D-alanine-D-alanine ligase
LRQRVRYRVPPCLPAATQNLIQAYALNAYHLLGCRDLARIDFRLDALGRPVFLECNPLPGLNPESGDIVILSSGVLSYETLIQGVLRDAADRCGVSIP